MRGIDFEAGGKTHRLRFAFNELCALEQETGLPIDKIGALLQPEDGSLPMMRNLRLFFWAGLGAKLSKEEAGEIMSLLPFDEVAGLILRAFVEAFPKLEAAMQEAGADSSGNAIGAAA